MWTGGADEQQGSRATDGPKNSLRTWIQFGKRGFKTKCDGIYQEDTSLREYQEGKLVKQPTHGVDWGVLVGGRHEKRQGLQKYFFNTCSFMFEIKTSVFEDDHGW